MKRLLISVALCLAAVGTATAGLQDEALNAHNGLRAKHGVPPLSWSGSLASTAQAWADKCVFEHATTNLGENMAQGTSGSYPPAKQIQSWYDEIKDYDFATGKTTGGAIGHFTQVVWKNTTEVGCGVAQCSGQDMLVCNYSPAGNFTGQYIENVPPLK